MIPSSICQFLERIGWKITLTEIRKKEVLHILGVQGAFEEQINLELGLEI